MTALDEEDVEWRQRVCRRAFVTTTFQRGLEGWVVNRFVNALYTTGRYQTVTQIRSRASGMDVLF